MAIETLDFIIEQSRTIADFAMDLAEDDPTAARENMVELIAGIAQHLALNYLGEDSALQLLADATSLNRPDGH